MAEKGRNRHKPDFKNCKRIVVLSLKLRCLNLTEEDQDKRHEVRIPVDEALRERWESEDPDTHKRAYDYLAVRVKEHLANQGIEVDEHIEGDSLRVIKFCGRKPPRAVQQSLL